MNTGRRGESSSTSAFIEMKDNPSIMKNAGAASVEKRAEIKDIEHVPVRDDPRAWSNARKVHLSNNIDAIHLDAKYRTSPIERHLGNSCLRFNDCYSWCKYI